LKKSVNGIESIAKNRTEIVRNRTTEARPKNVLASQQKGIAMEEKEVLAGSVRVYVARICWKCNNLANLKIIEPTIFTDAISEVVFECSSCSTIIKRTLRN
jgi:hypothetical protein